ncbi:hypothetical protein [Candidatus Phytoplasma sacchari]|nr:hypothetical protein [Candidatus Phytoplasma sacchari]KAB8122848.1 hypothetical protein F2B49_00440 [Candidatus Phytoplasma sacchari]
MNIKKIDSLKYLKKMSFLFIFILNFIFIQTNHVIAMMNEKFCDQPSSSSRRNFPQKEYINLSENSKKMVFLTNLKNPLKITTAGNDYYDFLKEVNNISLCRLDVNSIDELKRKYSDIEISFSGRILFHEKEEVLSFFKDNDSYFSIDKMINNFIKINILNDLQEINISGNKILKINNNFRNNEISILRFICDLSRGDISSEIEARINAENLMEIFITYLEIKELNNELILSLCFKTYSFTNDNMFSFNIAFKLERISFIRK